MYAVFPTLAMLRTKAGLSVREAAPYVGISHTYLRRLEHFLIVPPPDSQTRTKHLLVNEARFFIGKHLNTEGIKVPLERLSLVSEYAFFTLQEPWWNHLLLSPNDNGRESGPLFTTLLHCYFNESEHQNNIILYRPQEDTGEPFLFNVIADFCERYYNPVSFSRRPRKGDDWPCVPPFVSTIGEDGVMFRADLIDRRQIFHAHPTGYSLALFLLYSLLRGVHMSQDGINCTISNLPKDSFNQLGSCYEGHANYAIFSPFNDSREEANHKCTVRFTLTPPAHHKRAVIQVCLKDVFKPKKGWCWCLAPSE